MNYRTTALRFEGGAADAPLRVSATVATADAINGEVLAMDKANLGRFAVGAVPLLVDHQQSARAVVGSVEALRIEGDRLVADLLVTDAAIAEHIRRGASYNVSIGYTAPDARGAWELLEVSLVGVGADPRAGVNRSTNMEGTTPSNPNPKTPEPNGPAPAPTDDAQAKERERVRQLMDMGAEYDTDPREAILAGDTPEAFGLAIRQRAANNGGNPPKPNGGPAIIKRDNLGDPDDFSLRKLILALSDGKGGREVERTKEAATIGGAKHGGRHIPGDVLRGMYRRRDLTTATNSTDELVGTDHLGGEFIEPLREMAFSGRAGVRILDGLQGNVEIPRQNAVSTASWLATETGALTASEPGTDEITLSPKESGVMGVYSRRLLIQSDPSVEAFVREDQARTLALAVDAALLYGSGASGQPKGIVAYAAGDLASKAGSTNGTAVTWPLVVGLKTVVAAADAMAGTYVTSAKVAGKLEITKKETSGVEPNYILEGDTLANRPLMVTNVVKSGQTKGSSSKASALFYGYWPDAMIARWSGLDVIVDNITQAANRKIRVLTYQDVDIAIRHGKSFAVIPDALHD